MNIGVYANELKDVGFEYTNKLISLLRENNENFAVYDNYPVNNNITRLSLSKLVDFSDVMIVLGGDGTILQVIKHCAIKNVPVASVNLGHLGFLAGFEKNQMAELLSVLKNKKYYIEERTLIEAFYRENSYIALNDVVISKGENTRLINVEARVDDALLDNYYCDGMIVCTPTGSTAYSMSIGGPILAPNVKGMIINPISSHSLHSRPVVISDNSVVKMISSKLVNDCQLVIDGELVNKIGENNSVIIKKSKYKALFIRLNNDNFYSILLNKLNRWGVTENKE